MKFAFTIDCKLIIFSIKINILFRFKHKNPEDSEQVPNGFLSDCDPDSLIVIQNAMIDNYLSQVKPYDKFQFERIGFFSVDPDSSKNKVRYNF